MTRILFVGDAHVGLKVGLWPKGYKLDDIPVGMGKAQKFIWKQLENAKEWFDEGGPDRRLVLMGDHVHGPELQYPDAVVVGDVKTQCQAFIDAMLPLAAKVEKEHIYVIDDLSAHHVDTGRFCNDYIASELGAWKKQAYGKLDLFIQDIHLQLKHHGPAIGSRPHTEGNSIRSYMKDMHIEAVERGEKAPDIFVFAHYHRFWTEPASVMKGDRLMHCYYTPALCGADKRTIRNVKRLVLSSIGTIGLDIEGDQYKLTKLFNSFDGRVVVRDA